MKILVTGGAGFIGTNFIRLLMAKTAHSVVNFDLLTYASNRDNLKEFEGSGRYRFIQGDIADRKAVDAALSENSVDAVVNFAAESHVDRSIHDASAFIRANVAGTQTLIDAARARKIGRFLQVSTDEVYGDLTEAEPRFTERSPVRPSSPYAASKAAADMLVLAAFRTHKQPVVITRCSNNYGPFQHPEKLIPLAIHRARQGKPVPVYSRGLNIRDWIHVEDHCRGILRALEKGREGEVYNFGGASELRNIEVVHTILDTLQRPRDLIRYVADRPGHDLRYAINFDKAAETLGWRPSNRFADGIRDTIDWYGKNDSWLKQMTSPGFTEYMDRQYGEIK